MTRFSSPCLETSVSIAPRALSLRWSRSLQPSRSAVRVAIDFSTGDIRCLSSEPSRTACRPFWKALETAPTCLVSAQGGSSGKSSPYFLPSAARSQPSSA